MKSFKQFINSYLTEATISHFAHLGLDPNNPEHKDMVDAYNNGLNAKENKISAKPNQIKTFDQLKNTVAPHYEAIQQKRKEDDEDKEAFENKEAELVHHDPSTGVKVFKVRSGKGCAAVGGDTKWCTADRETGSEAMRGYDPEGEHSHVIHTPEKGNLSKIGIIGVKPGETHIDGVGGNFQDKGNNTVSDEDWEKLRKKYNLDSVRALHGVRGLHNSEIEHLVRRGQYFAKDPNTSTEDLDIIAKHSTNPLAHKYIAAHKNAGNHALFNVASKSDDPEVHRAIANHPNVDFDSLEHIAFKSDDPEVHKAILNHPKVDIYSLEHIASKSNDPEVHRTIAKHENANLYSLEHIASKSNDPEVHRAIANHPNANLYSLGHIASKSNDPEVHRAIANHPNVDLYSLGHIASKSDDPEVHKAILNHPNVDLYSLGHIASKSDDPEVHKAILNHPNVSGDIELNLAGKYGFSTWDSLKKDYDYSQHGIYRKTDEHKNKLNSLIDSEIQRQEPYRKQKQKEAEQYARRLEKAKNRPTVNPDTEKSYDVPNLTSRQRKQGMYETIKNILGK